jgi:hypothetical protein
MRKFAAARARPVARSASEADVRRVVGEWFHQQEREAIADELAAGPIDNVAAVLDGLGYDERTA